MVDLRLSNVCNLGCVMCGPKSSSFIKKEVEEHRDIAPKHNARQIRAIEDRKLDLLNPYTDKQIDEIIDEIDPMLEFIVQVVNQSHSNNYSY